MAVWLLCWRVALTGRVGFVQLPGMEVWFQRASDVVRRMRAGDVDLGILGMDMFEEFGEVRKVF